MSRIILAVCCLSVLVLVPACGGEDKKTARGEVKTFNEPAAGETATGGPGGGSETTTGPTPASREEARLKATLDALRERWKETSDSLDRAEVVEDIVRVGPGARSLMFMVHEVLKDEDSMARAAGVRAVVAIDPDDARPFLELALRDEEAEVRTAAATAWGTAGIKDLGPLLQLLEDDIEVNPTMAAAMVVEEHGEDYILPRVARLIEGVPVTAAVPLLRFLGEQKAADHATEVAFFLSRNDRVARRTAAEVLRTLGVKTRAVLDELANALEDEDRGVRAAARDALMRLTKQEMGFEPDDPEERRAKDVKAWRDWIAANAEN